MLPFQLLMVPIYILAVNLGLQNTYAGLFLPHITTAFGIFLMRQAFMKIPYEMDESARMDGANSFQIWLRILMPLVKPRSEEHTSELQSRFDIVCRLLLEK